MNTKHRLLLALLFVLLLCVCLAPAAFADGSATGHTVADLQNAVSRGVSTFILDGNMEIPADTSVNAPGLAFVAFSGNTLTIKGELRVRALEIKQGSSVVVDGGHLDVSDHRMGTFIIGDSLTVINGGGIDTGGEHWTENWTTAEKSRIHLNDGRLNLHFEAQEGGDAESMIAKAGTIQVDNVFPMVEVRYPLVLSADLIIPMDVFVRCYDGVTVPAGMTLTVNQHLWAMEDCVIDVFGTLENHWFVGFNRREGNDPRLIMEDGAAYSGWGDLFVPDFNDPESYIAGLYLDSFGMNTDQDGVYFFCVMVDLVLPSGLTEINAEVFAGDTFEAIFIPPSVVAIDDSAFSGMSGLYIYGHGGTEAETFAKAHGFEFENLREQD